MYDGTFAAFYLHFLPDGQDDVLGICLAQRSLELAAVGGDDLHLLAHVVLPLAQHLEGLPQAGAAHFQFIVFLVS